MAVWRKRRIWGRLLDNRAQDVQMLSQRHTSHLTEVKSPLETPTAIQPKPDYLSAPMGYTFQIFIKNGGLSDETAQRSTACDTSAWVGVTPRHQQAILTAAEPVLSAPSLMRTRLYGDWCAIESGLL
ncbi:hypothetical protein IRJ41_020572 [Triplophysa rosa]|uniref:Uncharacterized protein n=1 Tax=Triplophysa rosa TaxID=992332 RepID=A0A9W8C766_TRIRA|nr:hypothetical protein IRJ41_020572 [Triplophysa rosa]